MKEFTFRDFLIEKYNDSLFESMKQANQDGARYYELREFIDDCDLEEEVSLADGDIEADRKEFNKLMNWEKIQGYLGVKC